MMPTDVVWWTPRLLRAAYWVGHVLGDGGIEESAVRKSWINLPLGGVVDLVEMQTAYDALIHNGLLIREGVRLVPGSRLAAACSAPFEDAIEVILALIIETERPLWLMTAANDRQHVLGELIPEVASRTLESVIPDAARREAFLLARSRVVDAEALRAVGQHGEVFVADCCRRELTQAGRPDLAARVCHVSKVSDELGYDVTAPRLDGSVRRLEVKTTCYASANVAFFITRNEIEVGLRDADWFLIVTRIDGSASTDLIGWASASVLRLLLPKDPCEGGSWHTARLHLPVQELAAGLPPISSAII
jgi:hypothetical protein